MLASIPFVTSSRAAVTFVVTRYGIGAAHPGVVCVPNPAQDPTSAASLRSQRLASRPWISRRLGDDAADEIRDRRDIVDEAL